MAGRATGPAYHVESLYEEGRAGGAALHSARRQHLLEDDLEPVHVRMLAERPTPPRLAELLRLLVIGDELLHDPPQFIPMLEGVDLLPRHEERREVLPRVHDLCHPHRRQLEDA